jgi:hypothetical protein
MVYVRRSYVLHRKIDVKTLHITFSYRLTSTTLPWKRSRLLLGRPSLIAEYRKKIKSVGPVKQVSTKLIFRLWDLVRVPLFSGRYHPNSFSYRDGLHKLLKFNLNRSSRVVSWGPSEGLLILELECSCTPGIDLWLTSSWKPNVNKIRPILQALARRTAIHPHTHIQGFDKIMETLQILYIFLY